jgi:hypothetical protein
VQLTNNTESRDKVIARDILKIEVFDLKENMSSLKPNTRIKTHSNSKPNLNEYVTENNAVLKDSTYFE